MGGDSVTRAHYSDILTLYNLANIKSTKAKDPHYYVHHLMKERKN